VCSTWGLLHEETIRIRQGDSTYYIRCWLRLIAAQPIMLSYPLPFSMPSPGGINQNITKDKIYIINIVNIANICINISYWPSHFKISLSIIINKPNKVTYNFLKLLSSWILWENSSKKLSVKDSNSSQFLTILFILIN